MARISGGILGNISGKLDKVVYRVMNNQTFISVRPPNYNASKSELAVGVRTDFAGAVRFARFVNSIPELKEAWKNANIKGKSAFNRIIKYNKPEISKKCATLSNNILPDVGSNIDDRIKKTDDKLIIYFRNSYQNEKDFHIGIIKLHFIVYGKSPSKGTEPKDAYYYFRIDIELDENEENYQMELVIPEEIISQVSHFDEIILFAGETVPFRRKSIVNWHTLGKLKIKDNS